ncbi:phytanoyl-CoA dioxygenase (PhyH) family protein [Reticulomyxa filosa]|uniref:Phytanoyl-CoA dioxygenase (PhyH) family protein n=1 Tax=Reticulomyxa filosa TaxID=46433 RepID=X6MT54_RETFI|nr:phytanoyl-CoA dioxygenase (PhyH) family protein [Reticulomyxa filosa]|eukprot:ETO16285.1 phytanoyl-CoA dioxygenase (PhyH) family protein [Reticulomyxa filosa]
MFGILNNSLAKRTTPRLKSWADMLYWTTSWSFSGARANPRLTEAEKDHLRTNGYLKIENFVPDVVSKRLRKRIVERINEWDSTTSQSVFSSHRTEKQYKDTYFLNSGDKICYFWEEKAQEVNANKELGINKVGHSLHTLDDLFKGYVYGYVGPLCYDVGMVNPILLQSMYIFKQKGIGGEVSPHQDSTFLFTEPMSCYGFWLAVDETNVENGCIYVLPKSHQTYPLFQRFVRISDEQTQMIEYQSAGDKNISLNSIDKSQGVPVECKSGDLIILHGKVIHWSEQNTSTNPRHAFMMHCVDGQYHYPVDNWLQYPKGKPFPKFTQTDLQKQAQYQQMILNPQKQYQ